MKRKNLNWISRFVILSSASIFGILLVLSCFELMLRHTVWFDQLNNNSPTYIPSYIRKLDHDIYHSSGRMTSDGFRTWRADVDNLTRALQLDEGCKIVILGDSFVMGDGLAVTDTWPAKLQNKTNCTVYPFGKNGQASYELYDFYDKVLANIAFDILLIGVVSNDPHPRGEFRQLSFKLDDFQRKEFNLSSHLPLYFVNWCKKNEIKTFEYAQSVTEVMFSGLKSGHGKLDSPPVVSYGYENWENRLYEDDVYMPWLSATKLFFDTVNHQTHFILTPTTVSARQFRIFNKIDEDFEAVGIDFSNAYPKLVEIFPEGRRPRGDWANLGDGHPGLKQNELYSDIAVSFIENTIGSKAVK